MPAVKVKSAPRIVVGADLKVGKPKTVFLPVLLSVEQGAA